MVLKKFMPAKVKTNGVNRNNMGRPKRPRVRQRATDRWETLRTPIVIKTLKFFLKIVNTKE